MAGVVGVDLRGREVCVVKCPGKEIKVQQDLHLKFEIDESSPTDSQIWKWQVHHIPPMIFLFGSVKIDGTFACDMRSGIRPRWPLKDRSDMKSGRFLMTINIHY